MALSVAAAAVAWGAAEATMFFIVPDVLLTLLVLGPPRRAFAACGWAVGGALLGGALMYSWGAADLTGAEAALDRIPAIGPAAVERVRADLETRGLLALFVGPLTGTPYKIYAVESGALALDMVPFLLVSIPARGLRFVVLTGLTAWVSRYPLRDWSRRRKTILLLALWTAFYAVYFAVVPG